MSQQKNRLVIGVDATPFCRKIDGIGRYNVNLIAALAKKHPEAQIVLIGFIGDTLHKEINTLLPSSVSLYRIPLPRRLYQILFARLFALNLGRLTPKLNVLLCLNFTLFPYIKQASLKRFVMVHDTAFIDVPDMVEPRNRAYLARRVPWSISQADATLTVSEFTSERVHELFGVSSQKVHCISAGIQDSFFATDIRPSAVKNLPASYVLCVNTLEPRKNIGNLVRAHALLPMKLRKQHPLVLGGRLRGDSQTLARLIEKTPHVLSTGYVDDSDLPGLYKGASLFVLPPLYEGFGIPLIEAMVSRVPVIVSDIPLFHSIAGNTVTYANTRSPKELSSAIETALTKRVSQATIASARRKALSYSWDKVAERTWKLIRQEVHNA